MKRNSLLLLLCLASIFSLNAVNEEPEELGTVNWLRDFDEATSLAKKENKQILILFQEVPGCSTYRNYGRNVLSNPLMVEAIEQYFIPLAIYNNKRGKDAEILKKYNEPSWNNPVVRIVNAEGKNVVDRLYSNYSALGLYKTMQNALQQKNMTTDLYFKLLGDELMAESSGTIKETYFKMYCFWSGEGHLGSADGVLYTEPGFMNGYEVVKVKYDRTKISESELREYASKATCTPIASESTYRIDKDPQYYLKKSKYSYLPLSKIQRTKVNSALASRSNPEKYLSPKQLKWLTNELGTDKNLYAQPFEKAWKMLAENK